YASRRDAPSEFHRITIRRIAVGNLARPLRRKNYHVVLPTEIALSHVVICEGDVRHIESVENKTCPPFVHVSSPGLVKSDSDWRSDWTGNRRRVAVGERQCQIFADLIWIAN